MSLDPNTDGKLPWKNELRSHSSKFWKNMQSGIKKSEQEAQDSALSDWEKYMAEFQRMQEKRRREQKKREKKKRQQEQRKKMQEAEQLTLEKLLKFVRQAEDEEEADQKDEEKEKAEEDDTLFMTESEKEESLRAIERGIDESDTDE